MGTSLVEITEKKLEEMMERVLNSKRAINNDIHATHHEFLERYMDRWEARQKVWQKFKLSFVGAIAVALVGGLIWVGQILWRNGGGH